MINENVLLLKPEAWESLLNKLSFIDIKILELLYLPEITTTYFIALEKKIKNLNVKRTAVRNHVQKLEEFGLLKTINSGILLINSIPEIAENVKKLVLLCKLRWSE